MKITLLFTTSYRGVLIRGVWYFTNLDRAKVESRTKLFLTLHRGMQLKVKYSSMRLYKEEHNMILFLTTFDLQLQG